MPPPKLSTTLDLGQTPITSLSLGSHSHSKKVIFFFTFLTLTRERISLGPTIYCGLCWELHAGNLNRGTKSLNISRTEKYPGMTMDEGWPAHHEKAMPHPPLSKALTNHLYKPVSQQDEIWT